MRKVERAGNGIERVGVGGQQDPAYADDICLLDENLEDMRRLIEDLVEEAGKFELKVNANKTDIMKIRTENASLVHIEEAALQELDKFVYLRCELRDDGDIWNEINIRTGMSIAVFRWVIIGVESEWHIPVNKVKALQQHYYFGTNIWRRMLESSGENRRTAKKI